MVVIPTNKENEAKSTVVKEDVRFERKSTSATPHGYVTPGVVAVYGLLTMFLRRIWKSD